MNGSFGAPGWRGSCECFANATGGSALILPGVGMVREAELGYRNGKEYETHARPAPAELISPQGNLAWDKTGAQIVRAHVWLSEQDGSVRGSHSGHRSQHDGIELARAGRNRSGAKAQTQWPGRAVPAN